MFDVCNQIFQQLKSILDVDVQSRENGPVNVATPSAVIYWKRAVVPSKFILRLGEDVKP